jgi:S1-C subfamily serine protease
LRDGRVRRSYIGVGGQNVPVQRRVVRFHKLDADTAVMATQVEPNSPAASAGVRPGDYLVAFDGQAISAIDDLHRLLTEDKVGSPTTLTILRGVEKLTLTITPADAQRN